MTRILALVLISLTALMTTGAVVTATDSDTPPDNRPVITVNEFMPTDRSLSDCISVLPKPGCGSEARGGWAQTAVFLALIGGLGIIFTRIILGIRRRDAALNSTDQV